jgi:3'-phosphoadenosine 5'-phosphosulfate sulfotransferase (PAPS reductase)/FAD synthetase
MSPLDNHERIALHFSGGKDSLAVVHLLRPHWDRLAIYHVDTGDLLPEVLEIVAEVERMVPTFHRIRTDSSGWMNANGLPSDLVPTTTTFLGRAFGMGQVPISDRFECCFHNIMGPMHHRMIADGITLVIRGTKRADVAKLPREDGPTGAGYDLWLPIIDWSHDKVFAYLREVGAPICRVYEHKVNAPECATCPAWWNEGRAEYLKKHHPDLFAVYRAKLSAVTAEIMPVWATLQTEMEGTR